jgi:cyclic pyranopterin phosphate synthase
MSDGALFSPGRFVAAAEMRESLERELGALFPDDGKGVPGVGPARHWRVAAGAFAGRRVGIISAVSEPFCETCNRVRVTATGMLHTCLALDDDCDLRRPLRAGASDDELRALVKAAVSAKKPGHEFTSCGSGAPRKHMVAIGG